MSALKPVFREVRQAVIKGAGRAKDRLHQLADNLDNHFDTIVRAVRDKDRFDDRPGPVRQGDVSTFRNLQRRETRGDRLEHDHIPSSAALIRARELLEGRRLTRAERRSVHNDGVAVELTDLLHSRGRTWRNKNTQAQIDLDASDLGAAMRRDLAALKANLLADGSLSRSEINGILAQIRKLNLERGIL